MIELILVLLILGLSAAVAVPMLAPFSRGRALTDSSVQVLTFLLTAQDRAINEGRSARVLVDTGSSTLTLQVDGPDGYATPGTGQPRLTLPDSVTLSWESASEASRLGYIQFDADAGHDTAILSLTGTDGRQVYIGSWGPTESYRIYWPDQIGGTR